MYLPRENILNDHPEPRLVAQFHQSSIDDGVLYILGKCTVGYYLSSTHYVLALQDTKSSRIASPLISFEIHAIILLHLIDEKLSIREIKPLTRFTSIQVVQSRFKPRQSHLQSPHD